MLSMGSRQIRFRNFEFDVETLELRREGTLVHLQSQPAQVLACLVSHPGETVTREELRNKIWGNETFVDFDRGLNFCVAQIRSALNDDAAAPRFILTLPKRGYQFIAPVEYVNEPANSAEAAPTVPASGGSRRIAAWIWAGILFVALAAVAGFWLGSAALSRRPPIVAVARFDNETADPGMSRFADGLTDNVVEELTKMSGGHYAVIGNAQILRVAREERDLKAIGASLHAAYVVLGQIQSEGEQERILVHLIRLPEQTHLWVVRVDGAISDPLIAESGTAEKAGEEFSKRIIADSSGHRLPGLLNH